MARNAPPLVRSVFHPTDFSPASHIAFAHALVIALLRQTDFTILNAHGDSADWTRFPGVRETLERWGLLEPGSPQSAVFQKFRVRVGKVAAKGNAASATLEFIHESQPDLVVLATHGRSGLARWLQPSIASKIARRSRSMALLVPENARPFVDPASGRLSVRRILLPVDHTPSPDGAISMATRAAAALGDEAVEIELLHVGDALPTLELPSGEAWRFQQSLATGDVVDTISAHAKDADLIVMATDGRDGVLDVFRGSFTERVVRDAPCPVLAVPTS